MANHTILVVEDDGAIRRGLADALELHGFETLEAANGRTGLDMALSATYDLLLLDVVLPERDGFSILQAVRTARPGTPVILLTAKGDELDRVRGLKLGADDYVVKPFSLREVLARIEAVLRRSPERPKPVKSIELPDGTVDFSRSVIRYHDGETETLSEKECELLQYLSAHAPRVISRDELLQHVWAINPRGLETRTIDMHVARLRSKLRDDGAAPLRVLTVRGKGYQFNPSAPAAVPVGAGERSRTA